MLRKGSKVSAMFSKTFFSRLKAANDVTVMTGPNLGLSNKIPLFNGKNYNIDGFGSKKDYENDANLVKSFHDWKTNEFSKCNPTLGHYSLIDISKRLSNLHIITTNSDNLHQKAGSPDVIELNGNFVNTEAGKIPNIRWEDEAISAAESEKAYDVSAICEVFILIGAGTLKKDESTFPFLAKGNGCYMIEIEAGESEFTSHCNEHLHGDVSQILTNISMIITKVFK